MDTTRHRSMIKATPKVNNEANIPAIVDAPDDDSTTPDPANIWSRGDRLRAKTATTHEVDYLILNTSSPDRPRSAVEDSPSWISISSMKAVSNSNQTATAAIIPSWPGGESSVLPADSGKGIVSKPSRLDSALRENSMVSTTAKERRALSTNHTSYRGFDKGSQGGLLSVDQVLASPQVSPGSLSLVDRVKEQICWWFNHINITEDLSPKMPKASCTGTCCLILYAVGMTVGFMSKE